MGEILIGICENCKRAKKAPLPPKGQMRVKYDLGQESFAQVSIDTENLPKYFYKLCDECLQEPIASYMAELIIRRVLVIHGSSDDKGRNGTTERIVGLIARILNDFTAPVEEEADG